MRQDNAKGESPASGQWEPLSPQQVSVLFGPWILLAEAVLLVVFIWFRMTPLIIFTSFMAGMNLIVVGWKAKALDKLYPSLELAQNRIFANEGFVLRASLLNDKWLPLTWVEWEQESQTGIRWEEEGKGKYRIRYLWLLWKKRIQWDIRAFAKRRGVYSVGRVLLRSGDGFRFTEQEKQWDLPAELIVYPPLVKVSVPSLTSLRWEGQGKRGGFLEDPLLMEGLRDYQRGDELRRISWTASARLGTLQTKVFQPVIVRSLHIIADVSGFDSAARQDEFERWLSIVASVAVEYDRRGVGLGFATNAESVKGDPLYPLLPDVPLGSILDRLAMMTPKADETRTRWTGLEQTLTFQAPVFFFCDRISPWHANWMNKQQVSPGIYFFTCRKSPHDAFINGSVRSVEDLLQRGGGGI